MFNNKLMTISTWPWNICVCAHVYVCSCAYVYMYGEREKNGLPTKGKYASVNLYAIQKS